MKMKTKMILYCWNNLQIYWSIKALYTTKKESFSGDIKQVVQFVSNGKPILDQWKTLQLGFQMS